MEHQDILEVIDEKIKATSTDAVKYEVVDSYENLMKLVG